MSKLLLRRPFLPALGFDLYIPLRRIVSINDCKTMNDVCRSKMAYTRRKYHDKEYPIDCPEQLKAGFKKTIRHISEMRSK